MLHIKYQGSRPCAEFSLTPNLDYFTPTKFMILTPTFSKVPIEKYDKTQNFLLECNFTPIFNSAYGFRQEDFFMVLPIRLCKTCDPWGGAIFGPRGII